MTLKTRQLETIAAELHTRFSLAHISDASRRDVALAELDGARAMFLTAKAMGDTEGMAQQKARGIALLAELAAIDAAQAELAADMERGLKRAA